MSATHGVVGRRGFFGVRRLGLSSFVALALAVVLLGMPTSVASAKKCLVENPSTGLEYRGLQAAVDDASSEDTLRVKGTCRGATVIDKDLRITGLGTGSAARPALITGGKGRVLTVGAGASVTLESLAIRGGRARHGGGIHNRGVLTLDSVRVQGNAADFGGGIWNEWPDDEAEGARSTEDDSQPRNGTLIMVGSTVVSRNAADGLGGGVLNLGTIEMRDASAIRDNGTGAKRRWGDRSYRGGGVYNYTELTLTDSSRISGNAAGEGGGVANEGTLTLSGDSSISGNRSKLYGGGVWNSQPGSVVLHDSSRISGNDGHYAGGGIRNHGTVTLNDASRIADNKASTVYGTGTTCGPSAGELGGGVDNHAVLTLNDTSSVSGNRSRYGAGVMNRGLLVLNGHSRIHGNRAKGHGGGVYNEPGQMTLWLAAELGPRGPYQGCPIGSVEMHDFSSVDENVAKRSGGGIYGKASTMDGVTCGPLGDANVHDNGPDDCASPAP